MKKIATVALVALLGVSLGACTAAEERTVKTAGVGAATGAVIGAVAKPSDRGKGALVGGLIGGAAGALIGAATSPGKCRYRAPDGSIYTADCP